MMHVTGDITTVSPQLEAARQLLAELKAAYDALPTCHRRAVREALAEHSDEPLAA